MSNVLQKHVWVSRLIVRRDRLKTDDLPVLVIVYVIWFTQLAFANINNAINLKLNPDELYEIKMY